MSNAFASTQNRITNMPNLINKMVTFVMEESIQDYNNELDALVINIVHTTGSGVNGFTYGGKLYQSNKYSKKVNKPNSFPTVPKPFLDDYFKLAKQEQELESNKGILKQLFTILLTGCKTEQDVRDALPEFLVKEFNKSTSNNAIRFLNNYERLKPEAWNILDRPHLMATVTKSLMPTLAMKVVGKYLE